MGISTPQYYTARELTGLPGLPGSIKGVIDRAKREGWQSRKRSGRGGGLEYHISSLPAETQSSLLDAAIAQLTETSCPLPQKKQESLPAPTPATELQDLASMKTWQQQVMDARLQLIRLIEHAAPMVGVTKAIREVVRKARSGELPEGVSRVIPTANARGGRTGKRTLSERTLYRWWSDYLASKGDYRALAPQPVEEFKIPAWAGEFLRIYQQPQKPSVQHALRLFRDTLADPHDAPSEYQVRRFLAKYSRLEVQKGRKTASELRGQRIYRIRTTDELLPLQVVQCDGHSFKAKVAHPTHGRPFSPEICTVVDVATRCVLGWSVGLAESATTVGDAIRHCCTVSESKLIGGLPLILYTDQGAGNMATINADEISGLYARLGITHKTGRPGNPQARGLVERLNGSLWIPAAKELITYTGTGMDTGIARKVYLATQAEIRAARKEAARLESEIVLPFEEFLAHLPVVVERYHNTPHSALPKITDTTGRRRHMTPAECWQIHCNAGWQPDLVPADELARIARPHETAIVNRGYVRLHKKLYGDPVLEHYHGMQVMVAYDIHDIQRVWVCDLDGRQLVVARLDYGKSSHFSKAEIDAAQRHKNRSRVLQRRQEEVDLEFFGDGTIETTISEDDQLRIAAADQVIERVETVRSRPLAMPMNDFETAELLKKELAEGAELTAEEEQWLEEYERFVAGGGKGRLLRSGWQPYAERAKRARQNRSPQEDQERKTGIV